MDATTSGAVVGPAHPEWVVGHPEAILISVSSLLVTRPESGPDPVAEAVSAAVDKSPQPSQDFLVLASASIALTVLS